MFHILWKKSASFSTYILWQVQLFIYTIDYVPCIIHIYIINVWTISHGRKTESVIWNKCTVIVYFIWNTCTSAHLCNYSMSQACANNTMYKIVRGGQQLQLKTNISVGKGIILAALNSSKTAFSCITISTVYTELCEKQQTSSEWYILM